MFYCVAQGFPGSMLVCSFLLHVEQGVHTLLVNALLQTSQANGLEGGMLNKTLKPL